MTTASHEATCRAAARRIHRAGTGLLVVDLQERLLPAIHEKEQVLQNSLRLTQGAAALGLPILVTEQYRKGIGPTLPEVAATIPGFAPLEKMTFSALGAPGFPEALAACHLETILLCGIEAHVCVCQTALDLLAGGHRVVVAADAVSSRTPLNQRLALERMRAAGAVIASTEMILFELIERAGTDDFKRILPLVK